MNRHPLALSTILLFTLTIGALAQDAPPGPAPELKKLEPWVGNWSGKGKMVEPGGAETAWSSHGTYRWCMNGHWLQEDWKVTFDGIAVPIVFRNYLGWDRENGRYVAVSVGSDGRARLGEFALLPDGTLVQFQQQHQADATWSERERVRVDGDALHLAVDILMPEGASMQLASGAMSRTDEAFDGDFGVVAWMGGTPSDAMKRLARMAGTYDVNGEMVMMPGQPATKITGTDAYELAFGGTVVHGITLGHAEGMPEAYESHGFWAWNEHTKCVDVVFVDNMGQVGDMQGWWLGDAFVSIDATVMMGQPTTQRFVVEVDAEGRIQSGAGHTAMGTLAPFLSFRGSYKRR